jgi:hypothetical protein
MLYHSLIPFNFSENPECMEWKQYTKVSYYCFYTLHYALISVEQHIPLSKQPQRMFNKLHINIANHRWQWCGYAADTLFGNTAVKTQIFVYDLNKLRTIKFTTEVQSNGSIPLLDSLVTMWGASLVSTVYKKQTHTGCYLHYESSHPFHVRTGVIQSMVYRANMLCQSTRHVFCVGSYFHSQRVLVVYILQYFMVLLILRMFIKLQKLLASTCPSIDPSICPHRTTQLPLDRFSWNLVVQDFKKIWWWN